MAFCSISCQSKEASKSLTESTSFTTTMKYYDPISYHRSPSLSYSTSTRKRKESILSSSLSHRPPYFLMQSLSTSSSFSSSLSDISVYSTPFSCEDKGNISYRTTQNIAS
jgi:hypothetical protein